MKTDGSVVVIGFGLFLGSAFFGGGNAAYEDPYQLVCFVEERCEFFGFGNEF